MKNSYVKRVKCRTNCHQILGEIMPMFNNMYGEDTKKSAVYDCIQRFWDGREDVNNDLGCGRHTETITPSNVKCVKQLLDSDHCLSIRDVADELLINCKTVCLIVKDELHLWKLCAELVSKNLTKEQKKRRVDICCDWLEAIE